MGTRGFVGFIVDGTEKIAYNHWDSYPSGLGVDVLTWLRGEHLGFVRRKAAELRVVDGQSDPSDEDIERLKAYTDTTVGGPSERPTWYQLLRGTQGKPAAILDAGVVEDGSRYGGIEYSYFVDLDADRFLAYEGARSKLLGSWPLAELPDEKTFIKTVDPSEDDDD